MFKKVLLFSCSIILSLHFCFATSVIPSNHVKCDTLITVEGKTYVVEILREDAREVQFSLCNEPGNAKYVIVNDRILEIRRSNGSITKPIEDYPPQESAPLIKAKPKSTPSMIPPKKETEPANSNPVKQDTSCEVLTFSDGKSIDVRIIEKDNFNYFYMICGNIDDTVYTVPIRDVRLERKKSPRERKKTGCLLALIAIGLVYLIVFVVQLIGG